MERHIILTAAVHVCAAGGEALIPLDKTVACSIGPYWLRPAPVPGSCGYHKSTVMTRLAPAEVSGAVSDCTRPTGSSMRDVPLAAASVWGSLEAGQCVGEEDVHAFLLRNQVVSA